MDIELAFSRAPFVSQATERFALVKPHGVDIVALPGDDGPQLTHLRAWIPNHAGGRGLGDLRLAWPARRPGGVAGIARLGLVSATTPTAR